MQNVGSLAALLPEFKATFHCKDRSHSPQLTREKVLPLLSGRRVLIVSPFAPMMVQQVENGNFSQINDCPPPLSVVGYRYPYTFFNEGPHNNILETAAAECAKMDQQFDLSTIDTVFISCGAYSCLIAQHFHDNHQKNVCTLGRTMQSMFGYVNAKNMDTIPAAKRPYYITEMPEEYKPAGYERVEDGCYW